MPWRRALPWALLTGFVTLLYAPAFRRGFVSEDFLILRRFFEAREDGNFWSMAFAHGTGPWLDIPLVSFFRPLSSFFLQIEEALFGTSSGAYFVVHLALHLFNAYLLFKLVERLGLFGSSPKMDSQAAPWIATLVFAVYPMHPNTVVFIASFATLWCLTFCLAALCFYVDGTYRPALICWIAALASYEQAAVLPAFFVLVDILFRSSAHDDRGGLDRGGLDRRGLALRWGLAFGILGAYLAVRRLALGQSVGGYAGFRARLDDPSALLTSIFDNLGHLVYPVFIQSRLHDLVALVLLLATGIAVTVWFRGSGNTTWARLLIFGAMLASVSQAPFAFVGVVPGNGRYWYMASCGLGMALAAVGLALSPTQPSRRRAAVLLGSSVPVVLFYGSLLWQNNTLYGEAGRLTAQLQEQVSRLSDEGRPEPIFVAALPSFLKVDGVHAAQVFHWGAADSVRPPFSDRPMAFYPLPPLGNGALFPVASAFPSTYRWSDGALTPVRRQAPSSLLDIPDRLEDLDATAPPGCRETRLVLVAQGNHSVRPYPSREAPSRDALWPDDWMLSMTTLYPDAPIFWWVLCRDELTSKPLVSNLMQLDQAFRSRR